MVYRLMKYIFFIVGLTIGMQQFAYGQPCPIGDLVLASQEEVNQFSLDYPNCFSIANSLILAEDGTGSPIVDISKLSGIVNIGDSLIISNCSELRSLAGLDSNIFPSLKALNFRNNPRLSNCAIEALCAVDDNSTLQVEVKNNDAGCNTVTEAQSACIDPDCPSEISGFTLLGEFDGHTYYLSENTTLWKNAASNAKELGAGDGYLLSIQSVEENNFITSKISSEIFFGLSDELIEGEFVWEDQSTVGFTNFSFDPVINSNQDNYGLMNAATGEWSLANNFETRLYVVELPCSALESDLVLTDLSTNISTIGTNQEVPYQVRVRNIGNKTALVDSIIINVYLSKDRILDLNVDSLAGKIPTGNINPDGDILPSPTMASIRVPKNIAGPHYLIAQIDVGNKVAERNEDNNIVVSDNTSLVIDLTNKCLGGLTKIWTQTQLDTLLNRFNECTILNGSLDLQSVDLSGEFSDEPIMNLQGLSQIEWIEGGLSLQGLNALENLNGIENLEKVSGVLNIADGILTDVEQLSSLDTLGGLSIISNGNLTDLSGLNGVSKIYGNHYVVNNPKLVNLYSMDDPLIAIDSFVVTNNPLLSECNIDYICESLNSDLNYRFENNGPNCTSNQDVEDFCGILYPFYFEIFNDLNGDGIRDVGEPNFSDGYITVEELQSRFYMGNKESKREINLPRGEYTIDFDPVQFSNWQLTTTSSQITILQSSLITTTPISIGLTASNTGTLDTENIITYINGPKARCFETIELQINAKNTGVLTNNGRLFVKIDPRVEIISFTDAPDVSLGDGIYGYDYEELYPGLNTTKRIKVKIPSPEDYAPGTLLNFESYVQVDGGNRTSDFRYSTELKCSYDPNDKAVYPSREGNINLIDEYLTYTIRFQNTGNDTAYNVVIRDTLDEFLELNTFQMTYSEFDVSPEINIQDGRYLTFQYDNIYLPDSSTDYAGSQGYLTYRIKANEDIAEGESLLNTAHIYFDLNPAVVTNTVVSNMFIELPACEVNTIFFTQQSQIDEFSILYRDCQRIKGSLIIEGMNIINLNGLSNISSIDGDVIIQNTNINSLDGLNNLSFISGDIELINNDNLVDFSGIEELSKIGGDLIIRDHADMKNLQGLETLLDIGGDLIVESNNFLSSMRGLENLKKIDGDFICSHNNQLTTFTGLNNLLTINGKFSILKNDKLDGLTGLNDLLSIGSDFIIEENNSLKSLIGISSLENIYGDFEIQNNRALITLIGLNTINSISENLKIQANVSLANLEGLESLENVIGKLEILDNPNLISLKGLEKLSLVGANFNLDTNNNLASLDGLQGLEKIGGLLNVISNDKLEDLSGLDNLLILEGGLQLFNCSLVTLTGLNKLEFLGNLIVSPAEKLVNFSGLEQLNSIANDMIIKGNKSLTSTNGLNSVKTIGGDLIFEFTDINSLSGFDRLERIQGSLLFINNKNLDNIASLASLQVLGADLMIESTKLPHLQGLRNIKKVDGKITIIENRDLEICNILGVCNYLDDGKEATIYNNAIGCNTALEVEEMCSLLEDQDNDGVIAADDCDDNNPNVFPGADEVPNNGIDEDCDGEDLIIDATHQLSNSTISIYPNPVHDIIIIELRSTSSSLDYEIINMAGLIKYKGNIAKQKVQINIEELNTGMYLLKIYDTASGAYILDRFCKL